MNPGPSIDGAFLQRFVRWQDGAMTEAERAAFEAGMLNSEEQRRMFAEMQMRSALAREVLRRTAYDFPAGMSPAMAPQAGTRRRRVWIYAGLAAAVAVVAGALINAGGEWFPDKAGRSEGVTVGSSVPPALAAVTFDQDAEWETGQGPADTQLFQGTGYALAAGTVRMRIAHDDTIVTVAGPAAFEVVPPGHVRLREGRLSARVSKPDAGFTVLTDAMTVLDRGTVFGVNVREDGETLVSVVEGKVDVQPAGTSGTQQIGEGGTFVARQGAGGRQLPPEEVPDAFADLWPLTMGIDRLSHLVQFVVPRRKLRWVTYRSDSRLFLMPERRRITLQEDLPVDVLPGVPVNRKRQPDAPVRVLKAGTRVHSYLLFFRPEGTAAALAPVDLSGVITFAQPVAGIISEGAALSATDELLGHAAVPYRDRPRRGIESRRKPGLRDVVRISRDGRRVFFNLHGNRDPDEFRVLVHAAESF